MRTPVFVILALTVGVCCSCTWRECDILDNNNATYSMDEALVYVRDEDPIPLVKVEGFKIELPGVYFLSIWLPLRVTWYLDGGRLWDASYMRDTLVPNFDNVHTQDCIYKSDTGVLLKKTLEGAMHYDDFQEYLIYSTFTFPYWTWESDNGFIHEIAHYKFAFLYTIEYNSTICELTNIHWLEAEGSYRMNEYVPFPYILGDWGDFFRFDVPEEHIRIIKEEIHQKFDEHVVKAWCARYRLSE
uniref:Uncharacterized protein n=1 Tax=Lygus hesperus TaxID=30085 RepID=A0A146LQY0_LYGHE